MMKATVELIVKDLAALAFLQDKLNEVIEAVRGYPDIIYYPARATNVYNELKVIRDSITTIDTPRTKR